jgi:hypothetical protein
MSKQGRKKSYERLSALQVDKLHQKFMTGVYERAQAAALQHAPQALREAAQETQDLYVEKLTEMLLLAKRCRTDITAQTLAGFACSGIECIEQEINRHEKQLEQDPWSWRSRFALNRKFNKRAEAPLAAQTFGDDERIYLKLEPLSIEQSIIYDDVDTYISKRGYKMDDYIKGYVRDEAGKQRFKIGKLIKDNPYLLERFSKDEVRSSVSKYVVISRNKQDLERISTGRGWSSCMAADGAYKEKMPNIIGSMTLVAYLINENDPEINDPLGRLLLKPCDKRAVKNKKSSYRTKYFPSLREHFNHFAHCLMTKEEPLQNSSIGFAMGQFMA